jgi:ATP-binding cassette subfamily C protein
MTAQGHDRISGMKSKGGRSGRIGDVSLFDMRLSQMPDEVGALVRRYRGAFVMVAVLSALLNILLLAGSLYMMLIYDTVLPSHSLPSLTGLFAMLILAYAFQGAFELFRSRLLGDVANALDRALSHRVQQAVSEQALRKGLDVGSAIGPVRDLESVRTWLAGTGPTTLIDIPWILFFVAFLALLHVWLGIATLLGGAVLIGLTFFANRAVQTPLARMHKLTAIRSNLAETNLRHVEALTALGMRERMLERWSDAGSYSIAASREMSSSIAVLSIASRIGRMLLQSLVLTVGAVLVIDGDVSAGAIFASSILSARALAPVDQIIGNWQALTAARQGWQRICALLGSAPAAAQPLTALPAPSRSLEVDQLALAPPGSTRATVHGVQFALNAGDGLAIIGPSAAGKSTLGRALVGIWPPLRGSVRLDGAALDQYDPATLGDAVGYLPQSVELFDGTVAENIARMEPDAPSDFIIAAARAAGVHDMIVALPQGYDTPVGADGRQLSAGQQQRIGLARALYRDPFLLMLDEPNSNLDADGELGLERAIASVRARGGIAIVIAHRPSALANVNLVLLMRQGRMEQVGPRDELLKKLLARPVNVSAVTDPGRAPPTPAAVGG